MKKSCIILLISVFLISVCTSACASRKQKPNMIQSKRRFAEYMEPQQKNDGSVIDLSEGPKLRYDAQLGPQNLNFDIKIIDPY